MASEDLDFAHVLADAADRVSMAHFRSEELRTTTKGDGTPVSQIDFDVEQAMLDVVRAERPTDAFVGEEVGPHAGTSGRRWIVDGIDGTHNYADGRAGWGTIIAYEVDGEIVVGLVSAPRFGRRWWAVRGERRVVGAVPAGRRVRRGGGRSAAMRVGDSARRGVGDRHPVRGRDASVGATRSRGGSPHRPRRGASASRSTP